MEELGSYTNNEYNVDIKAVTETWLNEQVGNSEIALDNFTVYREDRCKVKTGRAGSYCMSKLFNVVWL